MGPTYGGRAFSLLADPQNPALGFCLFKMTGGSGRELCKGLQCSGSCSGSGSGSPAGPRGVCVRQLGLSGECVLFVRVPYTVLLLHNTYGVIT